MNNESPEPNPNTTRGSDQSLDRLFANRPHLRQRLVTIAHMIDQAVAEGCTAHEAEARAIQQIRQLGKEVLTDWAEKTEAKASQEASQENPKLSPYRKKNC